MLSDCVQKAYFRDFFLAKILGDAPEDEKSRFADAVSDIFTQSPRNALRLCPKKHIFGTL